MMRRSIIDVMQTSRGLLGSTASTTISYFRRLKGHLKSVLWPVNEMQDGILRLHISTLSMLTLRRHIKRYKRGSMASPSAMCQIYSSTARSVPTTDSSTLELPLSL